jgi:hypothetical protein
LYQYHKDESELIPMAGLYYLMRLGVVSISKIESQVGHDDANRSPVMAAWFTVLSQST